MKQLTKTQIEELLREQQRENHLLKQCLGGFMEEVVDLDEPMEDWACGVRERADPRELWRKLFGGEPRAETEYRVTQRDLVARLTELENVMSHSQEQLAEQITTMKDELQSAKMSREWWDRRIHSIWLLAKGMPEPWADFIFCIIANGIPSAGDDGGLFDLSYKAPYPGWAWKDGRAVYSHPSSEFRPSTPQGRTRVKTIEAIRRNILEQEREIARLKWEEHLSYFDKKTEAEIEVMRDTIWYGVIKEDNHE